MLKEREHVIARISQIVQTALTIGAYAMACGIYHYPKLEHLLKSKEVLFFLILIVFIWWMLIEYGGLNWLSRDHKYSDLFFRYLKYIGLGAVMLSLISFLLEADRVTAPVIVLFAVIDLIILFSVKILSFRAMKFLRRQGFNTRQLLVIADDTSIEFIHDLIETKDWGYRVRGIVSSNEEVRAAFGDEIIMLPDDLDVGRVLNNSIIDEVIYCKSQLDYNRINELVELCAEVGVVFRLKPGLVQSKKMKSTFTYFNNIPFLIFRNTPEDYLALKIKRMFDIGFSSLVLFIFFPLLLIIAFLIKLDDGGPVFFHQERVGLNGRRFKCLKFRTMVTNAEELKAGLLGQNEQSGPVFKIKSDPRITKIGHFLRKTSLDEFPQFINVLQGDMSVVGPRPPIPSEVSHYQRWQTRRLSMKPGITCIWQVSGRNRIGFEDWVRLDTQYIDQWSLKLDFIIILKTIKVMITGDGQ